MNAPFDQQLDRYMQALEDGARKGLARAGLLCLSDAVMDVPMVPLDEGTLKGSGSVFVGNELIGTSEQFASGNASAKPTPATQLVEQIPEGGLKAVVAFNTPYAARMHEGVTFEFSHSGHGAKFLEKKLVENHASYMEEVRDAIEEELASAGF